MSARHAPAQPPSRAILARTEWTPEGVAFASSVARTWRRLSGESGDPSVLEVALGDIARTEVLVKLAATPAGGQP